MAGQKLRLVERRSSEPSMADQVARLSDKLMQDSLELQELVKKLRAREALENPTKPGESG